MARRRQQNEVYGLEMLFQDVEAVVDGMIAGLFCEAMGVEPPEPKQIQAPKQQSKGSKRKKGNKQRRTPIDGNFHEVVDARANQTRPMPGYPTSTHTPASEEVIDAEWCEV